MSKEERLARMRQNLEKEFNFEEISSNIAYNIVIICKKFGWKIDYVLDMPIWKFNQITKQLNRYYKHDTNTTGNIKKESVIGE